MWLWKSKSRETSGKAISSKEKYNDAYTCPGKWKYKPARIVT